MQVKRTPEGEVVALFKAKELLAFIRSYLELGMGEIPMKLILDIEVEDHLFALREKELLRWGDKVQ